LVATWALAASWAAVHVSAGSDDSLLLWSVVLLAASAGSGWRLFVGKVERVDAIHVVVRLLIGGLATWAAAVATLESTTTSFAVATALLCAWHLGLAIVMRARAAQASELFLLVAWVQAFAFGPIRLEGAGLTSWWIAVSMVLTVVPWEGLQRVRRPLLTITALFAMLWCLDANEPWCLPLGLLAATVLLAASLWPYAHDVEVRPIPWLAIVAALAWGVVVEVHGPASIVAQLGLGLLANAFFIAWACWRPSIESQMVASAQLCLGLIGAIARILHVEALSLAGNGDTGARLGMAVVLLVFAALGALAVAFVRKTTSVTGLGLLTAPVLGLAGLLAVAGIADGTPALGQVGYSLTIAGVGLGLIVAGLRLQDGHWRQVGLAGMAVAAAKIVLIDLDAAAVGWRALSFIGLGALLIGGAFAYSRAARRIGSA
jgi:hypothetical protein